MSGPRFCACGVLFLTSGEREQFAQVDGIVHGPDACLREPKVGDLLPGALWTCVGTGGNCTAWSATSGDGWIITHEEGAAPPEGHDGPCTLSLERDGSIILQAECATLADAVTLAARFTGAL